MTGKKHQQIVYLGLDGSLDCYKKTKRLGYKLSFTERTEKFANRSEETVSNFQIECEVDLIRRCSIKRQNLMSINYIKSCYMYFLIFPNKITDVCLFYRFILP